jgi:uncharacterized protein
MAEIEAEQLALVRAAAESGVHQAQAMYAQLLLDGAVVERNPTLALHWFERAAKGGNLMAVNMVGRCLDQGWGVPRNTILAERWFRKAAERGLDWGMYNLATLLALGEGGVPQNRAEALLWLRRAAEQEHAKSLNLLGGFYEDGWEVERDAGQARELYRRSAAGGDFRGQFNYARLLLLAGEESEALLWLSRMPETATAAFLVKARSFLEKSSSPRVQAFAGTLSRV